ncbi:Kinesin-like protein KIF20B [Manis javanica]|nr:Kinesin-like protein KIF20B [Manis javanica]
MPLGMVVTFSGPFKLEVHGVPFDEYGRGRYIFNNKPLKKGLSASSAITQNLKADLQRKEEDYAELREKLSEAKKQIEQVQKEEKQTMDVKPRNMSSVDPGGTETEPRSTSFEISRNEVEVGIGSTFLLSLPVTINYEITFAKVVMTSPDLGNGNETPSLKDGSVLLESCEVSTESNQTTRFPKPELEIQFTPLRPKDMTVKHPDCTSPVTVKISKARKMKSNEMEEGLVKYENKKNATPRTNSKSPVSEHRNSPLKKEQKVSTHPSSKKTYSLRSQIINSVLDKCTLNKSEISWEEKKIETEKKHMSADGEGWRDKKRQVLSINVAFRKGFMGPLWLLRHSALQLAICSQRMTSADFAVLTPLSFGISWVQVTETHLKLKPKGIQMWKRSVRTRVVLEYLMKNRIEGRLSTTQASSGAKNSLQLLLPCGVFSHSGMWPVTCSCAIAASQSVKGYSIRGLRGHEPHLQGPEEPHLLQGQVASIKLLKKGPGYTGDGLLAWPEWTQKMKWGHQEELKYSVCNYSRARDE